MLSLLRSGNRRLMAQVMSPVLYRNVSRNSFVSCNSSVKHGCFGINTFNVGLPEVSTATVYSSDIARQFILYRSGAKMTGSGWLWLWVFMRLIQMCSTWFLPPSPCFCPACLRRQLCSFLFLHSLSCTRHWRCSCYIWIISAKKRWQELDPESGTRGWKDNSCKCHQGGQGLTSLKLPVGETDGRERWHLTSLEPRDVLHINMQTHLIRFIWPRVCVLKQHIVTGKDKAELDGGRQLGFH